MYIQKGEEISMNGEKNILWKTVIGFEGLYEVSNTGMVRSVENIIYNSGIKKMCKIGGRILKPNLCKNGYFYVNLYKDKKMYHKTVHTIVATSFISNPKKLPCINHKDGNKKNNNVENLEYCTYSYNTKHSWEHGLSIPTGCKKVLDKTTGIIYSSIEEAARKTNKLAHVISRACHYSKKSRWAFINE
jgi:hypothetical protein